MISINKFKQTEIVSKQKLIKKRNNFCFAIIAKTISTFCAQHDNLGIRPRIAEGILAALNTMVSPRLLYRLILSPNNGELN